MTACVRDLALTHPGKFEIHVAGTCSPLWENNPHVARAWGLQVPSGIPRYLLDWRDFLKRSHRTKLHYLTAFHRDLSRQLKTRIPTLFPKGDLHLSEEEQSQAPIKGRYWFIVAGGKSVITTKIWSATNFNG